MPWFDSETNLSIFFEMLAPGVGERILDVGAGRGIVANKVMKKGGSEVYAADHDQARVARMRTAFPSLKSYVAETESLPFEDSFFDKVYSTMAFHHFADIRKPLHEFARVLKPGGALMIVEIKPDSGQGRFLRFVENAIHRSHVKCMDMDQLTAIVKDDGEFEIRKATANSYVYFVLCAKAAAP